MSQQPHLESLRRQVGFDEWGDRPSSGDDVFVVRLGLSGSELTGWRLANSRTVQDADDRTYLFSSWISERDEHVAVRIDVELTGSRRAAHDELLQRLASVQLAKIDRLPDGSVGDVGFVLGDGAVVLFARGNAVVEVAPLSHNADEVRPLADAFDEYLMTRPPGSRARSAAALGWQSALADSAPDRPIALPNAPTVGRSGAHRSRHEELGLPRDVPLPVDDDDDDDGGAGPRTVKLILRGAEIREAEGTLNVVAGDDLRAIELVDHRDPPARRRRDG